MKRFLVLSLVFTCLVGLSYPVEGVSDKPKRGGTLIFGMRRDMRLMNPLVATRSTEEHIRNLMFEPLLGVDLQGKIQANLATDWTISNGGKLLTFRLRQGVKFHNGNEMTAEDVKFSMDYTMDPKNGAYGLNALSVIDRVEIEGKYTVKVHLKKPSVPFLTDLTSIQSFSVVPKESVAEGVRRPANFPPGTGPFKFADWKPKQRIVLERHGEYWGQKAWIDKLILRPVGNNTARVTALRAKDVDMIERVPHEWVKPIKAGRFEGLRLVESEFANFRRLIFNVAAPPFNDKKLRQAVAHALNKREILDGGFFGMGKPVNQKYPEGHKWYIKGLPSAAYDLDKARELVGQSGYNGEAIKMLVEHSDQRQAEAVTFQSQMKKVGLNIEFHLMDRGAFNSLRRKGEFALVFAGGSSRPDPSTNYSRYYVCEGDLNKRRSNFSGYCDKNLDLQFKKLQAEQDPAKRKVLLRDVLVKLSEDLPIIPIGFVPRHFALREYVKGFTTDGNASLRWWRGGLNYVWIDK